MAKIVKIKEIAELGIDEPNLLHIQESYLRQVAHSKPLTAKKKRKSDVAATGAKWYRQKGTGRARQGERTNPHMTGGGLAFPPRPRTPRKGLNKMVRISALRSAVLAHVLNGSAFVIQGKDFDATAKTKEVAALINEAPGNGLVCLVVNRGSDAWRSSRNIPHLRLIGPNEMNVRDLVDSESLVFSTNALNDYKEFLSSQNIEEPVEITEPRDVEAAIEDAPAEEAADSAGGDE